MLSTWSPTSRSALFDSDRNMQLEECPNADVEKAHSPIQSETCMLSILVYKSESSYSYFDFANRF